MAITATSYKRARKWEAGNLWFFEKRETRPGFRLGRFFGLFLTEFQNFPNFFAMDFLCSIKMA
ncbi:MAG: hypothetical protein EAZ81_07255 [Verrucomicrobia bacterium]|nr:MAG: hypothetical protein EAZ81_07255 [Verrucomicrobiota bacterium]